MNRLVTTFGLLILLLAGVNSTLYVVSEFERGIKLRFGEVI